MRSLVVVLSLLAWALWFGGLVALFVFVPALFRTDRDIAVQAAPIIFIVFQKYQLILACVTLVAAVAWRICSPGRLLVAGFVLLALATFAGVGVSIGIIPRMNELRVLGESSSPEFKKLHGVSMALYLFEMLVLLGAGVLMILANGMRRTVGETAPSTDSPA
jgi:hypothetical protein